jgi:low affinity Fe/Cu permease
MHASFNFKINTATAIFFVFMFRLVFVNIYALTSFQNSQTNAFLSSHLSIILKRRRTNEVVAKLNHLKTNEVETCEEYLESKPILNILKPNCVTLFLNSFFKRIAISSKLIGFFNSIKCKIYPKRYLALSLFRI